MEESLEDLDLGQPIEQRDRVNRIGGRAEATALSGLSEPLPLFRHEDVRVVVARRGAVQPTEGVHDLLHCREAVAQRGRDQVGGKPPEIFFGDAVRCRQQRRIADRP